MPGLFERGDPPEGWETKTTDMAGASSKVILASIASEMEYAPDAKPTAFEMSAELRSSVMELPMSPDGSTVKHRISVLEEAAHRQQHRNVVNNATLDALGEDQANQQAEARDLLASVETELNNTLTDMKKDLDMRFADQVDENDRTNRKMSSLKQESNQLRRKFAAMLMRLQVIENEMEITPPSDDDIVPMGFSGPKK